MISSNTPYKLREIIQDTYPNLFRPPKHYKNYENDKPSERNSCKNPDGKSL
jgi:hypothetical protein